MGKEEKQLYRDLILRGASFTSEEQEEILDYCWSNVANTILLLEAMLADYEANIPPDFE